MRHLIFVLPLLLSACASGVPAVPASVTPGVTMTAELAIANAADRRVQAVVAPWASTDIVSATVALYTELGTEALASQPYTQTDIAGNKQVVFGGLRHNTKYRIVTTAFAADGDDAGTDPDPIHDTDVSTCTTPFETTTDNVLTITGGIKLKLVNKTFSGSTTNGLVITGGGLTSSGPETASF
jgi:hypothetical protein